MDTRYEAKLAGQFNGRNLDYVFALDMLPVRDNGGVLVGSMSVFSYVADVAAGEEASRPVVFCFNGGPGSASAFLHMGGIGPKRVSLPADLTSGVLPPYPLEDSVDCLLDVADLVFMDPVNTGYGRSLPDAETDDCYSIEGDARCFAESLQAWIERTGRFDSPKFLLGESYGTHRAPFMASALMEMQSVPLTGIVLLGQALNVQETSDRPWNVTGAIASLPYMVATARFHDKASRQFESVYEAVEEAVTFGHGEYALALHAGNRLSSVDSRHVAERLEEMTGIPAEYYLKNRLRIRKEEFRKELLKESGLVLGRNDSRYVLRAADRLAAELDFDPSSSYLMPAFNAGMARHLREALGLDGTQEKYRLADQTASQRWEWGEAGSTGFMLMGKPSPFQVYPYPARLTRFLKQVPDARVFIGTGLYDSLTTVGAVEHLLRQCDLPAERITTGRYPAGHMMYTDPESSQMLTSDLRTFVRGTGDN
ncbi:MAG: S10 family peptidase [Acidimicrobiales bacterium]